MMEYPSCLNFSSKHSDFGCGIFRNGGFTGFCDIMLLFLMLVLGFKVLHLGCKCNGLLQVFDDLKWKSGDLINGFYFSFDVCGMCHAKISSCKVGMSKLMNISITHLTNLERNRALRSLNKDKFDAEKEGEEVDDDDNEEEEMDIQALKKALRIERERADNATLELEKERLAAASAAKEAMGMILRLQNELGSIKMQANQYQKFAEQKQLYDEETIHYLQWIILRRESERSIFETQLKLCREKLKLYLKEDGLEGVDSMPNCSSPTFGGDVTDGLIGSRCPSKFALNLR